jgi:hypothetical protein
MKTINCFLVIGALALSGCAHNLMRGSVVMKVDEDEGYVCLGENEVKEGDRVALFKSECIPAGTSRNSTPYGAPCKKIKIGEGELTKLLNEHYSVIKTAPNVALEEGTIVEVLKAR